MAQHRSSGARDLVITCIKGEGRLLKFWALPLNALETVKSFESHCISLKAELESSYGFTRSDQIPVGLKCFVKSQIKQNMWCRAIVIAPHAYSTILVQLLDYGNEEIISVSDVRSADDQILSFPASAIECILADVMPIRNEWSIEAIKFCEQHLLYNTLSCFVVSEYMKLPVVRVAKKGESEAFVQRLINGGLALIKSETVSPPPPSLSYKINTMDVNTIHLVRVSCIENAHKFYVQLSAAEMELKHLMDTINRLPRENYGQLAVPAVNTPCLAQLSTKPCYYRARICQIQQSRCKVFFVDYGFSEVKDLSELRAIPPTFIQLSAQAICCSLPREVNIESEEFKRLIGYEHLELHVLSVTNELCIVKLFRRGQDLIMSPQLPQNYIQQKLNPGAKCEVTVSYVNDFTEFYCQLTHLKDQQNIISNILNSGYNFMPVSFNECAPEKPVCVKFSEDNLWYRARIMKVNHENDIEVFFVDFGNYDNVSLNDVKRIGPDLLKLPVQAFRCCLFETPIPADSKAKDDAFDLLEELTADQCLLAHINTFSPEAGYGITLYMKNSTVSINEKIKSSFLSIPATPVNDIENVYVTSVDSPNSFFAQFEKLDSDKLSEMQEEINTFYSGIQNTSFVPKEGNFVCARFNEDNQFYRAKVEKCRDGFCDVYFIDYGNREAIPIRDVHCMDFKFTKYPQFGIECAFEKCPSHVSNDKLSDVMLENSFQLKMIKKENDKWYVSLVERFPGNEAIFELFTQFETPVPRSIHGTGLSGYQEKPKPQAPRCDSWNNDSTRTSQHINKNEAVKMFNNEQFKRESPNKSDLTKEFEDYSVISIPSKAYRNVYVSFVINPSEFYCQIEEDSPKLQLLMKTIEDAYALESDSLNLSNFVVDAPCCAMFEDGAWYRGKIKKVGTKSCDIFFVDYGNTDDVCKTKIKKLRSDLFRWPSQAVRCKAFNVSPKGKDWNVDEVNAFIDMTLDKSFVAQFVECDSSGSYAVNLVSIGKLEDDIFNKEFVHLGYGRLQDTKKSLVLNSHAASANLSFGLPDVSLGSSEAVQVTYGLNPGEIFCQLKSCEKEFKQMMTSLQNYYNKVSETESLIDRPHAGMICVAQFFLDSAWYRVEIKKVETNKIVVFYVDYGNSETVDRKKVRCINQDYTTLPVQAIKCRIRGIKPPGKSWTVNNELGKYFEGDAVCKFISKEGDSFIVDITCNRKDVAQMLISDQLALPDSPQTAVTSSKRVEAEPLKVNTLVSSEVVTPQIMEKRKDSFVFGQLLSVVVSFIENPSKFWCQLLDESDFLDKIMGDIEAEVSGYPSVNSAALNIGSFCIAQYFEDEAWYRAQIKSCELDNTYKVFFVDYGNTEVVSLPQMKSMPPELLKYPPQCFECCLQNTPKKLLPEMTTLFRDTVSDVEEITAKVEKICSNICTVTLLFEKDDLEMNVSELLFGVEEPVNEIGDMSKESPQFLPPDVPLGLHDGYVSTVNSPQDFYIQLAGAEDPLADLSEELAEVSESSPVVNPVTLCVGYACFTQYSEDNNWYRAEVIAVQDSAVKVLFVDYGNVDTVEKSSLRNLSEKHLHMPPLAIKCKLNGIIPAAEDWSEEAINTFQDMVLESCLGITFISKDIPATVNITKDDKEIAQCLVDMELANFESCTETGEAYAEDHLAPAPIEDPLSSLPNDQSYPIRKLSSTRHVVKICYVDSYDKFYVTPLELGTELDTVMTTLNILYGSAENPETVESNSNVPDVLEDPKVSMPCVAKYSEDDAWYRALITEIDGDNIYVTFIDYGNSEITTLSNLRPITPELLKIPPIALECSLFGIEVIPGQEQEITAKLEECFVDEVELEMEICELSPYKIKLSNNGDFASMLIKEGLAKEQYAVPVVSETFVDSSKITFVDESLEYRIQISKRFFSGADKIIGNVKFCEIENDLVVFHVVSTDLEDDLQKLQEKLQEAYSEPSQNLANVACMDFCATKYMEDENWYRAQILSCDKEKFKVRFIDYGNCETVDKTNIYELLGDFTVEPQFSVKCILFGLKADKNKEVELQNRLDELVYHEPVELKLCKHAHAVYDLCITSVVCDDTDITEMLSNEILVSQQYVINSQLDPVFKATVSKIQDDTVFLLPSNVADEREAFQCKLQNVCKDLEVIPEIQVNYLYAAKVDDTWYRVSVINISDCVVTVDLVDFGTTKVVSVSEFVPLPLDICHQPIFLQPCVLKSHEDPTGNAKIISIDDLSIGCEISCELQKTYPIVHPVSIKILEVHSGLKGNQTKDQDNVVREECSEEHIENDKDGNEDIENFSEEIKDVHAEHYVNNEEKEQTDIVEREENRFVDTEENEMSLEETDVMNKNINVSDFDESVGDEHHEESEENLKTEVEPKADDYSVNETSVPYNEFDESMENSLLKANEGISETDLNNYKDKEIVHEEENCELKENMDESKVDEALNDMPYEESRGITESDRYEGETFNEEESDVLYEKEVGNEFIETELYASDEDDNDILEDQAGNEKIPEEKSNESEEIITDKEGSSEKNIDTFNEGSGDIIEDQSNVSEEAITDKSIDASNEDNDNIIENQSNTSNEKMPEENDNELKEAITDKKVSSEKSIDAVNEDNDNIIEDQSNASNEKMPEEKDNVLEEIITDKKASEKSIDMFNTDDDDITEDQSITGDEKILEEKMYVLEEATTDKNESFEKSIDGSNEGSDDIIEDESNTSKKKVHEDKSNVLEEAITHEKAGSEKSIDSSNEGNDDIIEDQSNTSNEKMPEEKCNVLEKTITDKKAGSEKSIDESVYDASKEEEVEVCSSDSTGDKQVIPEGQAVKISEENPVVESGKVCDEQSNISFNSNSSYGEQNLDETLLLNDITSDDKSEERKINANKTDDELSKITHDSSFDGITCDDKSGDREITSNKTDDELSKITCDSTIDNIHQNSVDESAHDNKIQPEFEEQDQEEFFEKNDEDFQPDSVRNSSEDTDKENNRGIEDSYQLSGSVQVKISYIAISDGSVIFAVQPLYLQDEFLLLKQSMQDFYSTKATPYDANANNYCVVFHEDEWCRGKILQSGDSTILLIDYGTCTSVDSSKIKNLDSEHSNVPPFAVWCTLFSVVCPPEKSETAKTFLCDKLKNTTADIKILEGGEPYKINMFVHGLSILNELLKSSLVTQKLPNMYLEPGSYSAKLSFLNLETVEIFVNLSIYCDDYNSLFEAMQSRYKVEDFVSSVVESGIYAAFYNDSWYRGLVVSSGNEVQVYLVDIGETISGCKNLCFLLPEHCLQPAFAVRCRIPFSEVQATEISDSLNNALKAAEFLVNIEVCLDSNTISATLIDEQIVNEVKSIGLAYATTDPVTSDSSDPKLSHTDISPPTTKTQEHETSERLVGYLEETFTAEPS